MRLFMLVLAGLMLAFDFQNILSWWRVRVVAPVTDSTDDFTIIVPLFGHPRYFAGRAELHEYMANVLVALEVSTPIMQAFAEELEAEGWRVGRYHVPEPNPAGLVRCALADVTTTHALRLDADTQLGRGLREAVAAVAADGADLCSVKCEVSNTVNLVTRMQHLEYRMAMLGRHIRPWLTSGACFIGRTEALRAIFERHSLWTPGEDIETGVVAKALRLRVKHCDFVVRTDAPDSWRALFRQRKLWWAGNFRHWTVNLDRHVLQRPVMAFYASAGIWSTVYWRWWRMVDLRSLPRTLILLWAFYVVATLVANWQVRSRYMLLVPLYALAQGSLMPFLGSITYVKLAFRRRRLGRYRFGYRRVSLPAPSVSTAP
jgi:cellulose synthase/poly-beta-1,6-N-acetylglucosamine synthase-like glycosyltransferase